VQHLNAGAFSYTSIEAAISSYLQNLGGTVEQAFISSLINFTEIPLVQNILIGLAVAGIVVLLTALYLYAASSLFLTSGQILTPGDFLLELFQTLFGPVHAFRSWRTTRLLEQQQLTRLALQRRIEPPHLQVVPLVAARALAVGVGIGLGWLRAHGLNRCRPAFKSPHRANEDRMTAQEIGRQFHG
jgi:hypothetical protein